MERPRTLAGPDQNKVQYLTEEEASESKL